MPRTPWTERRFCLLPSPLAVYRFRLIRPTMEPIYALDKVENETFAISDGLRLTEMDLKAGPFSMESSQTLITLTIPPVHQLAGVIFTTLTVLTVTNSHCI